MIATMRPLLLLTLISWALAGPPTTRRDNVREILHGVEMVDAYRWLEDQQSAETRSWIDAQNKYTRSILDKYAARGLLRKRFTELERLDAITVPVARAGRYFLRKRRVDQQQFVLTMREGLNGDGRILVDPHKLATDNSLSVWFFDVTDDGKLVAYRIQKGGKDEVTVRLLQVDTGEHLRDELPEARYGSFAFRHDASGYFYTRVGGDHPRLYEHVMGTPVDGDKAIFGEGYGPGHIPVAQVSDNGRWLMIQVFVGSSGDRTEVFVKDLRSGGPIRQIGKGIDAAMFVDFAGDRLLLQTNWKAPRHRVVEVDLARPEPEHWKELIPQDKGVIEGISLAGGKLFVNYLEDVKSRLKIYTSTGKLDREIPLPSIGTVSGMQGRWSSEEAFFQFTSFHVPPIIFRYYLFSFLFGQLGVNLPN
jgi:prolyl oligopeptidase